LRAIVAQIEPKKKGIRRCLFEWFLCRNQWIADMESAQDAMKFIVRVACVAIAARVPMEALDRRSKPFDALNFTDREF
jgi:hypothetical protein